MQKNDIPCGALGQIEVLLTNINSINMACYLATIHVHTKRKKKHTISTCDVIIFYLKKI